LDLMNTGNKPKWGDEDDLEEFDSRDLNQEITTESIPDVDGSVVKTVVEYRTNDKGQTVKVIKKVRMRKTKVKINKRVEERKQRWRKFGECSSAPRGPEPGITSVGDDIVIDMVAGTDGGEKSTKKEVINLNIVCRNCGKQGDHWTLKCPYFKTGAIPPSEENATSSTSTTRDRNAAIASLSGGGDGKYVPPSMRRGGGASSAPSASSGSASATDGDRRRDETATIRVTNLSEDTKESDLADLFRAFGPISRIYLAKDKITNLSKGFAFINFVYRDDAAKAIEKLSGKFGYDHLILHLEWAKPSNK